MVEELVLGDDVEEPAVDLLLAADHLGHEREQQFLVGVGVEQRAAGRDRLVHPMCDDRDHQLLLGREVAKQRPAPDARAVGDLADSHLDAALAEHLGRRLQKPRPVTGRVGALVPGGTVGILLRDAFNGHSYRVVRFPEEAYLQASPQRVGCRLGGRR